MCWHLCLASFSPCVCESVPAPSPPTSVPAPKPCTLQSEARYRAARAGKGNGAVFPQLHLTRAIPVRSPRWCAHLLPSHTPVTPGAKPSRAPCRAQCATLARQHEGSRGCPRAPPGQGALLRLRLPAPQPLRPGECGLFPLFLCIKVPSCPISLTALLHSGWAVPAVADVLLCIPWVMYAAGPRAMQR